jgi:hypothetical protein
MGVGNWILHSNLASHKLGVECGAHHQKNSCKLV